MSRSHPKVRAQFDRRQQQAEEEAAIAAAQRERTQRGTAVHERVDPKWREEEPGTFHVRPEAVIRLTHDAMRLGMEDLCNKVAKIGSNPTIYIMIKTGYEKLAVCMKNQIACEAVLGYDAAANANILETSTEIETLIFKGSGGDHAAGEALKGIVPEWSQAFEMLLREKEAHLMSEIKAMTLARQLEIITSTLVPIVSSLKTHTPYICKQLKKRPFGNIRMYIAALHATVAKADFAAISADLEKACGKDLWAKIAPFLV